MMLASEARGWGAAWQTLTFPHDAPDRLADTMRLVKEGWRRVRQGRAWRLLAQRVGIVGTLRKVEVTHGGNGWHPHIHLTYLTARPLSEGELEEIETVVYDAWSAFVVECGYRPPQPDLCPIAALRLDSKGWAEYVGKVLGWELAGQEKRSRALVGRTPFEILASACAECAPHATEGGVRGMIEATRAITGRATDTELWREYEAATKGARQLSWSHGLKQSLGVTDLSESEELELGDVLLEQVEETVYAFQPLEWRAVWRRAGRLECLAAIAEKSEPLPERTAAVRALLEMWVAEMQPGGA